MQSVVASLLTELASGMSCEPQQLGEGYGLIKTKKTLVPNSKCAFSIRKQVILHISSPPRTPFPRLALLYWLL